MCDDHVMLPFHIHTFSFFFGARATASHARRLRGRCSELVSLAKVTHALRRLSAIANWLSCQSRLACGSARGRGGRHSTRALAPSQRIFVVPIAKRPRQPPEAHMPSGRQPKVEFSVHGVAENWRTRLHGMLRGGSGSTQPAARLNCGVWPGLPQKSTRRPRRRRRRAARSPELTRPRNRAATAAHFIARKISSSRAQISCASLGPACREPRSRTRCRTAAPPARTTR